MSNNKKQVSNKAEYITLDNITNDPNIQEEGLYIICGKLNDHKKYNIKRNLNSLKYRAEKGLGIYENFSINQTIKPFYDIDDAKDLNEIKEYITYYNEIINDPNITEPYKKINKTFFIWIYAYGTYKEDDIYNIKNEIENYNPNLIIFYQQKDKDLTEKDFSAHANIFMPVKYNKICEKLDKNITEDVKIKTKDGSVVKEIDNSMYQKHHLFRAPSSNAIKAERTGETDDKGKHVYIDIIKYKAMNIKDDELFKQQFVQYPYPLTEEEETTFNNVFDYYINTYFNIIYKTDNKTNKKDNKKTTNKDKQQDKPKEEAKIKDKEEIEICNISTPVPLGMIRDIFSKWPNKYYNKWVCVKGDIMWSAFTGFITNCPYKYEEIEDIIREYWNKMPEDEDKRSNPEFLNNWAKENIQYSNTNQYFFCVISIFNDYITFDDYILDKNDEGEFDYDLYISYKNKGPSKLKAADKRKYNELTKQYRELKNTYHEIYNTDKNKLIYSHYIRDFNIFHIFTEQYNPSKPSHYDYYKDSITRKIYVKNENIKPSKNITFSPVSQQDFKGLYDEDIKKIINTNKQYFYNMMYKYTYVRDEDIKAAERMLYIRGLGIKEDIDKKRFFDFVRSKLLNEESIYKHNFILWGDKNSLKTSFIDTLSDFIEVHKLEPSKINAQFNTEFKASIILIDELPANMKERTKVIETLKRNTSTTKIEIERKGYDKEIINNKSNIIINTNHKEIGGLFDYQENGEMFKRFYIIETKEIQQDLIKEYVEYLQDPAKVKAFIELLKNLPPLTNEELNNTETQQQYYNYVKDNTDNRRVLTAEALSLCVRKKDKNYFLKMLYFIKTLKNNDIITSKEKERQLLQDKNLINYDDKKGMYIIQDIYKFYKFYYSIDEDEDCLKKFLKSEYNYIVKEQQQEDNDKEQQQEDNDKEDIFEVI